MIVAGLPQALTDRANKPLSGAEDPYSSAESNSPKHKSIQFLTSLLQIEGSQPFSSNFFVMCKRSKKSAKYSFRFTSFILYEPRKE